MERLGAGAFNVKNPDGKLAIVSFQIVSARMAVQIEEAITKVLDAQAQSHGPLVKSIQLLTDRQAKFELALQRIQDSLTVSSYSHPKKPKHHPYHA